MLNSMTTFMGGYGCGCYGASIVDFRAEVHGFGKGIIMV
jgi:hypothetical protein